MNECKNCFTDCRGSMCIHCTGWICESYETENMFRICSECIYEDETESVMSDDSGYDCEYDDDNFDYFDDEREYDYDFEIQRYIIED